MFLNKMLVMLTLACAVTSLLTPATAHAIHFGTAVKSPPGYQLKLFPFYYEADISTDKDGNPSITGLGLTRYGVMIGNFYQAGDVQLNAIIPVARVEIGKVKSDDAGVGDIQLRAGWNVPVEWADIMPALMVKVPTGSFDRNRKANVGDGQTDLVAEFYFFKLAQPLSFDAAIKYNVRFRNPDTDVTPGNEFTAEGLVTARIADRIRIGPAVNFLIGDDTKKGERSVPHSGPMRLAVGGEIWYGRFDNVKISLAGYRDVLTRNANEGFLLVSRITFCY